jgi:hypothetical protein
MVEIRDLDLPPRDWVPRAVSRTPDSDPKIRARTVRLPEEAVERGGSNPSSGAAGFQGHSKLGRVRA